MNSSRRLEFLGAICRLLRKDARHRRPEAGTQQVSAWWPTMGFVQQEDRIQELIVDADPRQ